MAIAIVVAVVLVVVVARATLASFGTFVLDVIGLSSLGWWDCGVVGWTTRDFRDIFFKSLKLNTKLVTDGPTKSPP